MSVTLEQALPFLGKRVKVTFRGDSHTPERPNHGGVIGYLLFAEDAPPFGVWLKVHPVLGEKGVDLRGDAQAIEEWTAGPVLCSSCRAIQLEAAP
jgi:hypothetical protein